MIKLSVGHIHYFSFFCFLILSTITTNAVAENYHLRQEDHEFIQKNKEMSKNTSLTPIENQQMDHALDEARHFFKQLQQKNPTLKKMQNIQLTKRTAHYHILVFASLSLGKGLDDLLTSISKYPDAAVVFRGIRKGMNLGKGILEIQHLAAKKKPVPNIMIDPTLFQKYKITSVPTILILDDKTKAFKARKVLARVQGLSDPKWLLQKLSRHEIGNWGIKGPVKEISEPNLIDVAKARLAKIDWDKKKQEAIQHFWLKQHFYRLPRANKNRVRTIDPSVLITKDMKTNTGVVFAHKGDVINPLCDQRQPCKPGTRPFTQAVVIFDPRDKQQIQLLNQELPNIKKLPEVHRITYIATAFDKGAGWDSYKETSDHFDAPIYVLTPDLIHRFKLEYSPSIIMARGNQFVVQEFASEEE